MVLYIKHNDEIVRASLCSTRPEVGRLTVQLFTTQQKIDIWDDQICGVDLPAVAPIALFFENPRP